MIRRRVPIFLVFLFFFMIFPGGISPRVCLASPYSRIVSLAPNLTEILYELGLEDRIAAVTTYCNYPERAKSKPKIGGMSNPSLEAVVSMKPDLVILTVDGNPPQFERNLKRLGIRTCVFRAARISELPGAIRDLGRKLRETKRAEALASAMEKSLEDFGRSARRQNGGKVLFIVQPEPLMAAGKGTAIDEAITLLGWKNIASRAGGPYPKLSVEEVIVRSPDVIFISREMAGDVRGGFGILKKLSALEAVRSGRVYTLGDGLFRMGPRVVDGIGEMSGKLREWKP